MLTRKKFDRDKSYLFGNLIKLGRLIRQSKDTPTLSSTLYQVGPIQNDENKDLLEGSQLKKLGPQRESYLKA